MKITLDMNDDITPRRGDVLLSPKSTYLVLRVRLIKRRVVAAPRFSIFVAREEELDDLTIKNLLRSANRAGGRQIIHFHWYPRTPKKLRPDT